VRSAVAAVIASRPAAEWEALAAEHDLPLEPVRSATEAAAHPQAGPAGVLTRGSGGIPRLAFPARFDGDRPRAGGAAPALGADTERLLDELGLDIRTDRRRAVGVGRQSGLADRLRRRLARWRARRG
jgi:crotonobetainyl-CoA:carnitine CoA-transferase CaiB-like acyl-CoA transferase